MNEVLHQLDQNNISPEIIPLDILFTKKRLQQIDKEDIGSKKQVNNIEVKAIRYSGNKKIMPYGPISTCYNPELIIK